MRLMKLFGVTCAALAAVAVPVKAADLPQRVPSVPGPVSAPALFSWTGFYIGAHGGGAWGTSAWSDPFSALADSVSSTGFLAGGCYPMSTSRILRLLPHYARLVAAGPVGLMKLFRAQTTLNRFRPSKPHCYGYFLGGRQGVGTVLAKRLLNKADHKGWPIYLETQERRCANLYARLGFETLQAGVETLPGGPLTWAMWREPRISNSKAAPRHSNVSAAA